MAKDDERPQFNPKHRIAGAIILVSLAVIFVPMLLDESSPPAENQTLTQIPARDAPLAETKVAVTPLTPEPMPNIAATTDASQPGVTTPAPLPVIETAEVEAPPMPAVAEKKTETVAKAKPVSAKPSDVAEKISKGWMVQVGTFANTDNAGRLRDKLAGSGYSVNSETITVQGSKAVRLRVGPYRDKSSATKAHARLQKDLNIQGLVLAVP